MTYSIVARDPATGRFGVAVQSHWFAVGRIVPWAEAGVGAVATQSFAEASYGPLALDLMRRGKTAREAMDALLLVDDEREARQVAIVGAAGDVATHTGEDCLSLAGHRAGDGYSVQANMMASPEVWPAMARGFDGDGQVFLDLGLPREIGQPLRPERGLKLAILFVQGSRNDALFSHGFFSVLGRWAGDSVRRGRVVV